MPSRCPILRWHFFVSKVAIHSPVASPSPAFNFADPEIEAADSVKENSDGDHN